MPDTDFTPALEEAAAYRARIATSENRIRYLENENAQLRFELAAAKNEIAVADEAIERLKQRKCENR
jgi:hypothetical protein